MDEQNRLKNVIESQGRTLIISTIMLMMPFFMIIFGVILMIAMPITSGMSGLIFMVIGTVMFNVNLIITIIGFIFFMMNKNKLRKLTQNN